MNNPIARSILLVLACTAAAPVLAQSYDQLKAENEGLKAQLHRMQAACSQAPAPEYSGAQTNGRLQGRIDSIRVGFAERSKHRILVTVAMTLHNAGNTPLALNYQRNSYSITDENGYTYDFSFDGGVKGIPTATTRQATTSSVISPGGSQTVTFITSRNMSDGQTPGSRFDINATFGQYVDEGQGKIRKVQDFPVAFVGQPASSGISATQIGDRTGEKIQGAASRLLDGLFK